MRASDRRRKHSGCEIRIAYDLSQLEENAYLHALRILGLRRPNISISHSFDSKKKGDPTEYLMMSNGLWIFRRFPTPAFVLWAAGPTAHCIRS